MTAFQPFSQFLPPQDSKPIVVIGAGLAGLFAALKLSEQGNWPIVVVSPAQLGDSNASAWAQAGIAAAVGAEDSPQLHSSDTIAAGAGLNDADVVASICAAAAEHITQLDAYGVPFDRLPDLPDAAGSSNAGGSMPFALSREAAHSAKRIVRCTGDSSGRMIIESLVAATQANPRIQVLEGALVHRLLQARESQADSPVCGVEYHFPAEVGGSSQLGQDNQADQADQADQAECYRLEAAAVLLACGGIGALFEATTNPASALGQGLGMAARAGAVLADCEFVQFHPTALDLAEDPKPLASEALRGEGALLLDAAHKRFMLVETERGAELAPRDIVARGVFRARRESGAAYLDCRHLCPSSQVFASRFPTLWSIVQRHKLDPYRDLLPVIPAAHYHMGGIATDLRARSSVPGLWAIGEVACTGLHGANRLASNSLLEAVVMASNAARDILQQLGSVPPSGKRSAIVRPSTSAVPSDGNFFTGPAPFSPDWRRVMSRQIGVERSSVGIYRALQRLAAEFAAISNSALRLSGPASMYQQQNIFMAALAVSSAALLRTESLGSHFFLPGNGSPGQTEQSLPAAVRELVREHSNNGRRSFLNWHDIQQIVQIAGA